MKKMSFIISSIIIFLFVIGGISYAYLLPIITGSSENISVLAGDMVVTLTDGAEIIANDFIPGDTITKTFTIQNNGNVRSNYQIYLDDVINTFNTKSEVVYTLSSTNNGASVTNNTVYPSSNTMIATGSINANTTQNLTLTIRYLDLVSNDINNMGKVIKGKIQINQYSTYAKLVDGPTFNAKVKTLSGTAISQNVINRYNNDISFYNTLGLLPINFADDSNVNAIEISDIAPGSGVTTDIVSSNDSDYEILAWFDNGTIYLYSEANELFFNENSSYMFNYLVSITSLDLSGFNSMFATNMSYMFGSNWELDELNLGNNFDTSLVTNMSYMFSDSPLGTFELGDKFDTSSVTDMAGMFSIISNLTELDLGDKFDTSNVTDMSDMFNEMSSLETLDLGDKFNTSNVVDMNGMFYIPNLEDLDLGDYFDTSKVTNMSYMFNGCEHLTTLNLGDKFDTSKVTNLDNMFGFMYMLQTLYLGNKFDTSSVTNMGSMFTDDEDLTTIYAGINFSNAATGGNNDNLFNNTPALVGGSGTTFDSDKTSIYRARIDCGVTSPGYFTFTGTSEELATYCDSASSYDPENR